MTSANSLHGEGHPKLVLWDNPGGWGAERGGGRRGGSGWGTYVLLWLIHVNVWQKSPQ